MEDDTPPEPEEAADSSTALFLGLYLILLAFFVLLNTMAHIQEERVKAAIASLQATFSSSVLSPGERSRLSLKPGTAGISDSFRSEVRDLFQSAIPLARFDLETRGNVLRVHVRTEALFHRNEARVRADAADLFSRLAAVLAQSDSGELRLVEIMQHIDLIGADKADRRLSTLRSAALGRTLVGFGVPPYRVTVGLGSGDPDEISISFRTAAPELGEGSFRRFGR